MAYSRIPRGAYFIESSDRCGVGRVLRQSRICFCLFKDFFDRIGESIEVFLCLGFNRLHHQGLIDQQREIDGRRVIPEIEKALGQIRRVDPVFPDLTLARLDEQKAAQAVIDKEEAKARALNERFDILQEALKKL